MQDVTPFLFSCNRELPVGDSKVKHNIFCHWFIIIVFAFLFFGMTLALNAGTVMVKDFSQPGSPSSSSPWNLTDVNGTPVSYTHLTLPTTPYV